jgi:hypothetical protein
MTIMEHAIQDIRKMYLEKMDLYRELLDVMNEEKRSVIRADIPALWETTRKKQALGDRIQAIRDAILDKARDPELLGESLETYSFATIVASFPEKERKIMNEHIRILTLLKRQIASVVNENKRYLEESLRTVEDLMHIFTRNCGREERYGRDNYLRPAYGGRKIYTVREV